MRTIRATSESFTYQLKKSGNNQKREEFIRDYNLALAENKRITDKLYDREKSKYNKGELKKQNLLV